MVTFSYACPRDYADSAHKRRNRFCLCARTRNLVRLQIIEKTSRSSAHNVPIKWVCQAENGICFGTFAQIPRPALSGRDEQARGGEAADIPV